MIFYDFEGFQSYNERQKSWRTSLLFLISFNINFINLSLSFIALLCGVDRIVSYSVEYCLGGGEGEEELSSTLSQINYNISVYNVSLQCWRVDDHLLKRSVPTTSPRSL